jgi:hypothetical protein
MGTPRKCPECKTKLVPIVYGMPNEELFNDVEQGKFLLGGCDITGFDPTWGCPEFECGWRYTPPEVLAEYEKSRRERSW